MNQEIELEQRAKKSFFSKGKVERYLQFILKPSSRTKLLRNLAHFKDLDFDKLTIVKKDQEKEVLQRLSSLGVTSETCYIISENPEWDMTRMRVSDALREIIGNGMGSIVIFHGGKVILYQGEDLNSTYLSHS